MTSVFNAVPRADVAVYCNVCVANRPVWQFEGDSYCAWCRWRVEGRLAAPAQLPERAFRRARQHNAPA